MFKIDWRTKLTVGLTLISAFAIAGYILGHQLGEETGKKDAHTKEYERHAANEIERTCLRLDPTAEAECVVRVMNSTHENKRAESDLIAQRNTARWALLMLLTTIAMAFITLGGVYYVWRTLNVTREIGEAQVRAYVAVVGTKITLSDTDLQITAEVKNYGSSPALNVHAWFGFVMVGDPQSLDLDDARKNSQQFSTTLPPTDGLTVKNGHEITPENSVHITALKRGQIEAFVVAGAEYETVFKYDEAFKRGGFATLLKVEWKNDVDEFVLLPTEGYDDSY